MPRKFWRKNFQERILKTYTANRIPYAYFQWLPSWPAYPSWDCLNKDQRISHIFLGKPWLGIAQVSLYFCLLVWIHNLKVQRPLPSTSYIWDNVLGAFTGVITSLGNEDGLCIEDFLLLTPEIRKLMLHSDGCKGPLASVSFTLPQFHALLQTIPCPSLQSRTNLSTAPTSRASIYIRWKIRQITINIQIESPHEQS